MGGQRRTRDTTGAVRVDGATLRYIAEGGGRPFLVIGSAPYYARVFSRGLRDHLRLVSADARHFGAVEPAADAARVTFDTYAQDVEAMRRALRLGTVIIGGHSIHGLLAVEYARRYPQHVSHLVIIAAPPFGMARLAAAREAFWREDASPERKATMERQSLDPAPGRLAGLDAGQVMVETYIAGAPRYWHDADYDCRWLWEGVRADSALTQHLFGALALNYDLAQTPGAVDVPTFLARGRYDYVVPYTAWDTERAKLPNLSYHLFARSGHTPPLEEPAAFDRALLRWIRETDR